MFSLCQSLPPCPCRTTTAPRPESRNRASARRSRTCPNRRLGDSARYQFGIQSSRARKTRSSALQRRDRGCRGPWPRRRATISGRRRRLRCPAVARARACRRARNRRASRAPSRVGVARTTNASEIEVEIEIALPQFILRRIDLPDRRVDADRLHILDHGVENATNTSSSASISTRSRSPLSLTTKRCLALPAGLGQQFRQPARAACGHGRNRRSGLRHRFAECRCRELGPRSGSSSAISPGDGRPSAL